MNRTELITAVAQRLGTDQATATAAVDGVLAIIMGTVRDGRSVSLSGFGVFEPRARVARAGRNPRTGDTITLPARTVPAFRAGLRFRRALGDAPDRSDPTHTPGPVAGVRVIIDPAPISDEKARSRGKADTGKKATKKAGKKVKATKRGTKTGKSTEQPSTGKKSGRKSKK